jgi:hypothetical protein
MKNLSFFIVLIYLTFNSIYAEDFDFRKVRWGMNQKQVMRSEEKKPFSQSKEIIGYRIIGSEFNCYLGYIFTENKLVSAFYRFMQNHKNKNLYIKDYKRIKKALIKKYGEPLEEAVEWFNDIYIDTPQDWGKAVSLGHLTYVACWNNYTTEIGVMLWGDNDNIGLSVNFDSIQFKNLQEKQKMLEVNGGF